MHTHTHTHTCGHGTLPIHSCLCVCLPCRHQQAPPLTPSSATPSSGREAPAGLSRGHEGGRCSSAGQTERQTDTLTVSSVSAQVNHTEAGANEDSHREKEKKRVSREETRGLFVERQHLFIHVFIFHSYSSNDQRYQEINEHHHTNTLKLPRKICVKSVALFCLRLNLMKTVRN